MQLSYASEITTRHPSLVTAVIHADRITATADVSHHLPRLLATARQRLEAERLSEFPEIQAWRHAFSEMGLKPTQYRCAAESLLRRLNKTGDLPRIHPLVDLCNHVSISHAVPIAVFDLAHVSGDLTVRSAVGSERYAAFNGDIEHPARGEVIFADDAGQAHARRWTHRQSATSAVRETSSEVLIVAEALHDDAHDTISSVLTTLTASITETWGSTIHRRLIAAADQP
ncbi:B3/B4 domain-containing protein [Nesterenkonia ebinurensis]|uniref:B3/B4 domain-containing protein n=1 Tax=Nesterenkonia ebinurensis TaxID=2608252 RepID=UPI00123CC968|nr:phenylalanine--tRNA ligase beta subunit-related protein [Nesterenkonia ebinurensis]